MPGPAPTTRRPPARYARCCVPRRSGSGASTWSAAVVPGTRPLPPATPSSSMACCSEASRRCWKRTWGVQPRSRPPPRRPSERLSPGGLHLGDQPGCREARGGACGTGRGPPRHRIAVGRHRHRDAGRCPRPAADGRLPGPRSFPVLRGRADRRGARPTWSAPGAPTPASCFKCRRSHWRRWVSSKTTTTSTTSTMMICAATRSVICTPRSPPIRAGSAGSRRAVTCTRNGWTTTTTNSSWAAPPSRLTTANRLGAGGIVDATLGHSRFASDLFSNDTTVYGDGSTSEDARRPAGGLATPAVPRSGPGHRRRGFACAISEPPFSASAFACWTESPACFHRSPCATTAGGWPPIRASRSGCGAGFRPGAVCASTASRDSRPPLPRSPS